MIGLSHTRFLGAFFAFTTCSIIAAPAMAGDSVLAESLYQEGLKLFDQKKYDEACPRFAESQRQDPATGTQIALAKCYEEAGKTASAWAQYKELAFTFKKAGNAEGEKAASDKATELEKHLSKLQINAAEDTPGLVVRRDGEELAKAILGTAVAVDPGAHVIEATAPGYQVWQTTVTIGKDGDAQTVTIPALSALPKPANPLRTAAFVVGGVGAASVVVGGIFGLLAVSDKSRAEESGCDSVTKRCTQAGQDLIDGAKTKAWVSTLGIGIGAAALGTGVVLLVMSGGKSKEQEPKPLTPTARVLPSLGPQGGGVSIIGSF